MLNRFVTTRGKAIPVLRKNVLRIRSSAMYVQIRQSNSGQTCLILLFIGRVGIKVQTFLKVS